MRRSVNSSKLHVIDVGMVRVVLTLDMTDVPLSKADLT